MVKLVDTPDLGSGASRRVGSSPIRRTKETGNARFFYAFASTLLRPTNDGGTTLLCDSLLGAKIKTRRLD